ncbi:MAG: hypothetical protein P8K79_09560 [Mariniblastus sp.]|nr:hypothetical protein [Mariniblastus sp.]
MLRVFITIDTEFWPRKEYRVADDYIDDFQRDIHGRTPEGDFGLTFQLEMLRRFDLRAVCLVEALHPYAVGHEPLKEIVELVLDGGHDVQLHLHTEWLNWMSKSLLPGRSGQNMHDFSLDEQSLLIASGLAAMKECGAGRICAFRAGNYGADNQTLQALAQNDILYDTSHNTAYLDSTCRIQTEEVPLQPGRLDGVLEVPISFFRDFRKCRHAQFQACSSSELEYALLEAWEKGWESFVIVSHSFELIRRGDANRPSRPDPIVLRRFERFCHFLSENRDKFETCTFADLPKFNDSRDSDSTPIRMKPFYTCGRIFEQLRRRMMGPAK